MASIVFKDAYVDINSVDLSAYVRSVTLNTSSDVPEDTAMGDDSRSYLAGGLRDATFDVEFNEDDGAGAVSATLWSVYTGGAAVAFILKPNGSTTSTSNPKYTGSCILTSYNPFGGSVGDVGTNSASFQVTGDVTRATSD